ncbi:MAG: flagellar export chaperone FlgN [Planctomycetaceae bacterium]
MREKLLDDVCRYLPALLATQKKLAELYARKQQALVEARLEVLQQLVQPELDLTCALQQHLRTRRDLLRSARQAGLPHSNIRDLLPLMAASERADLEHMVVDSQKLSRQLRRASSVHWIIARKSCQYYGEILELFANRGRTAPTYAAQSDRETSGGAILDASV